jgi:Ran GTPase-activating protein (RanGAP) involved in mRNA processing and transport
MSTRLSKTIASLHETRIVELESASIDAEGASALADALTVNTSVTKINLKDNQFGAEGASALADALKVNTTVTTVVLWNNAIGDEGASVFADALKENMSVTNSISITMQSALRAHRRLRKR